MIVGNMTIQNCQVLLLWFILKVYKQILYPLLGLKGFWLTV